MRRRYLAGESLQAIADDAGCVRATVAAKLRRMGIKVRGRGGGHRTPAAVIAARDRKVLALYYRAGMSSDDVADVIGVSPSSVLASLRRIGFGLRPPGRPAPATRAARATPLTPARP